MQPVARFLPQVYRKLAREATDEEALLMGLWPSVVGEGIAARTKPLRLFGSTLIVEAADQVWRRQLAQMTGEILARLNAAAGKGVLAGLEFRVAVRAPRRQPGRAPSASGLQPDEAAPIADPHLRRLYRLSRKRALAGK